MAIIKSKTMDTGVSGEYWSISKVIDNRTNIIASLSLWINEDAKKVDGNKPLMETSFVIPAIDLLTEEQNHVQYSYTMIKASNIVDEVEQNFFADAVDA